MIRENRRPLLAFALVATVCAATLVQGVRSEALQVIVAAQVPQMVVSGAHLVPVGEPDAAPATVPQEELPAAAAPDAPAPAVLEQPSDPSPKAGGGRARTAGDEPEAAGAVRGNARPPGHAQGVTRPDRTPGRRSHAGAPRHRAGAPAGHPRRAEDRGRGVARRSDHGRHHRHPGRGHDTVPGRGSAGAPGKG